MTIENLNSSSALDRNEIQDGGFENSVAQISPDTHDSNEIPTAIPTFLESGQHGKITVNTALCLVCRKSNMSVINRN